MDFETFSGVALVAFKNMMDDGETEAGKREFKVKVKSRRRRVVLVVLACLLFGPAVYVEVRLAKDGKRERLHESVRAYALPIYYI